MSQEKKKSTRQWLTDKDRDNVLRLFDCGFSYDDISNTMHISTATVSTIRSAYLACERQDWSALQKLSTASRATVDWAMKRTGADKEFEKIFNAPEEPEQSVTGPTVDNTPDPITREDFLNLCNTMQDICYLLTEIRDMLK